MTMSRGDSSKGGNVRDKFWMTIAGWLPHQLVMWAAIRLVAHATTGSYSYQIVPELTAMDALARWERYHRG